MSSRNASRRFCPASASSIRFVHSSSSCPHVPIDRLTARLSLIYRPVSGRELTLGAQRAPRLTRIYTISPRLLLSSSRPVFSSSPRLPHLVFCFSPRLPFLGWSLPPRSFPFSFPPLSSFISSSSTATLTSRAAPQVRLVLFSCSRSRMLNAVFPRQPVQVHVGLSQSRLDSTRPLPRQYAPFFCSSQLVLLVFSPPLLYLFIYSRRRCRHGGLFPTFVPFSIDSPTRHLFLRESVCCRLAFVRYLSCSLVGLFASLSLVDYLATTYRDRHHRPSPPRSARSLPPLDYLPPVSLRTAWTILFLTRFSPLTRVH